jgi:DNA-directed RNA polymerase subunit RPC12/RpoP
MAIRPGGGLPAARLDTVTGEAMPLVGDQQIKLGPECPSCGEPWLRATNLAARYRCVNCLRRFELRSECTNCGAHSTIARMSDTANVICRNCGGSMLEPI